MKKKILSIILSLFVTTNLTYASMWPVFSAPSELFLRVHNFFDSQNCPANQGKLLANISIPVGTVCGTYCPDSWNWVGTSDNQCHQFNRDFELLDFSIQHYSDQNGTTRYSEIEARYGDKTTHQVFARFTFITPKEHWFCIEKNSSLHTLTCANDI